MPNPTNAEVLDEILNGALKNDLAPIWTPPTDATDDGVYDILNRKDLPGYVMARDVVGYLCQKLKWGMVPYAYLHLKNADGTDADYQVFNVFSVLYLAAFGNIEPPLHLELTPLMFAMNILAAEKVIDAEDAAAIASKEIKISVAERRWGYGVVIPTRQIAAIRLGGV